MRKVAPPKPYEMPLTGPGGLVQAGGYAAAKLGMPTPARVEQKSPNKLIK